MHVTLAVCLASFTLAAGQSGGTSEPIAQAAPSFMAHPGLREFSGRVIVRPTQVRDYRARGLSREQAVARHVQAGRRLQGFEIVRRMVATDEFLLRVPPGSSESEVAAALMPSGDFEYVEPDWLLAPLGAPLAVQSGATPGHGAAQGTHQLRTDCPDDPLLPVQWHHAANRMNSCAAWDLITGGPAVSVGVCDTGLRLTHEDLQLHRLEGYNAVDKLWESQGGLITPVHYHGTRTTGTVAANGNNALGVVGVGWDLSHRMLRVSNVSDGGAYLADLQHAVRTSIESGDRVASVSYYGASSVSNGSTATYAKSLGGLMVWGADNSGTNYSQADRDADDLIVVGATTESDTLWVSSSYGAFVDLVAPGVNITTTDSGSDTDYATASGTSYACPLAAGVCAMIWSARPTLSPDDVERALKAGAEDLGAIGIDNFFGYGRVNLPDSLLFDPSAVPSAKLSATPASGLSPLSVTFRDLSSGVPTAWAWDFGDGDTSTQQNPQHTYSTSGSFDVSLAVTNALGADQTLMLDAVVVDFIPPIADFVASATGGLSPLTVDFSDTSTGGIPDTWAWDFGDGVTSNLQDPAHDYLSSGYYTVSLTVTNAYGSDMRVRTNYIAVDFIAPAVAFSGTPTTGASPYVVQFSDESGGGVATGWLWTFGDGGSSTAQNPAHTYTVPGLYSVRLQASNAYGSDALWRLDYIDVGPGGPLLADFEGTPTSGSAPMQVVFSDLSIGNITGWEWNFGDGQTSLLQNPTHTYTSPGEYDVSLQVNNADGADDQIERQKYVVVQ